MIHVIFEKKDDGSFGYPTFISGKGSPSEAVDHFLDGILPREKKYQPRKLVVARLDAFDEFVVEPRFHVEGGKWDIGV